MPSVMAVITTVYSNKSLRRQVSQSVGNYLTKRSLHISLLTEVHSFRTYVLTGHDLRPKDDTAGEELLYHKKKNMGYCQR